VTGEVPEPSGVEPSSPAPKRAFAPPVAVAYDRFTLVEAAYDVADAMSVIVAQHVAALHIRLELPDAPAVAVAHNAVGVDLVARVEELRRVALVGRSAGYTGDDRKKDSG
jgi:hypothetical protein